MVQDQLVEYITSQTKAGVAADTIKATLVAAGWQAADVDDTLKRVQGPAAGSPVSGVGPKPISVGTASPVSSGSSSASGPQTIRVSDLVSSSLPDKTMSASATKAADARAEATKKFLTPNAMPTTSTLTATAATSSRPGSSFSSSSSSSRGPITTEIVLGILMVAFGALAAYFLFANRSLSSQVAALSTQSTGVTSQVSALQNQLDASTTELTAEVASATMQSQELALNLSFYAVPPGTVATTTSTTILTGTVSVGSSKTYVITTPYGAKVIVANSKDPKVIAALAPLVGTTTIPFGGTYTPGVNSITLTVINGVSLIAPPAVATSTATSSASTTDGTTTSTSAAPMIPATATSSGQ